MDIVIPEVKLLERQLQAQKHLVGTLTVQKEQLQKEVDQVLNQNSQLSRQIQKIRRIALKQLALTLNSGERDAEVQSLRHQLEEQRTKNRKHIQLIAQLQKEKDQADRNFQAERADLMKELAQYQKSQVETCDSSRTLQLMEHSYRSKQSKVEELEKCIQAKETQVQAYKKEIDILRQKIEHLQQQLKEIESESIDSLTNQHERELMIGRRAYQDLKVSSSTKIDHLQHKLASLNNQLLRRNDEQAGFLKERDQMNRIINQLQITNKNLVVELQNLSQQYDQLQKRSQVGGSTVKYQKEIEYMKGEHSKLIATILNLSNQLSTPSQKPKSRRDSGYDFKTLGRTTDYQRDQSPVYANPINSSSFGNVSYTQNLSSRFSSNHRPSEDFFEQQYASSHIRTQKDQEFPDMRYTQFREAPNQTARYHTEYTGVQYPKIKNRTKVRPQDQNFEDKKLRTINQTQSKVWKEIKRKPQFSKTIYQYNKQPNYYPDRSFYRRSQQQSTTPYERTDYPVEQGGNFTLRGENPATMRQNMQKQYFRSNNMMSKQNPRLSKVNSGETDANKESRVSEKKDKILSLHKEIEKAKFIMPKQGKTSPKFKNKE